MIAFSCVRFRASIFSCFQLVRGQNGDNSIHKQSHVHAILDLDLDFFVWPVVHSPEGDDRPSARDFTVWRPDKIRKFLETRCALKADRKIPGHEMSEHHDAFFTWRRWLREGILSAPFDILHVDAHADLWTPGGWRYLVTELLALSVDARSDPRIGTDGINEGNYLSFAIANRWVRSLTYVFPHRKPRKHRNQALLRLLVGETFEETVARVDDGSESQPQPRDIMAPVLRNNDRRSGMIELRCYSLEVFKKLGMLKQPEPKHVEPVVPFKCVPEPQFKFGGFTHMTIAQSPRYAPASADRLLTIFRDYFIEN